MARRELTWRQRYFPGPALIGENAERRPAGSCMFGHLTVGHRQPAVRPDAAPEPVARPRPSTLTPPMLLQDIERGPTSTSSAGGPRPTLWERWAPAPGNNVVSAAYVKNDHLGFTIRRVPGPKPPVPAGFPGPTAAAGGRQGTLTHPRGVGSQKPPVPTTEKAENHPRSVAAPRLITLAGSAGGVNCELKDAGHVPPRPGRRDLRPVPGIGRARYYSMAVADDVLRLCAIRPRDTDADHRQHAGKRHPRLTRPAASARRDGE